MRKLKQQPINLIKSLEELISDYDRDTLARALSSFKANDLGWQVFKAALMKEYLVKVSYQLDLCSKTGKQIEAAYEAGAAQTMYDTANSLIDKYVGILEQRSQVIEDAGPQR